MNSKSYSESCLLCGGEHHINTCSQTVCEKCGEKGHVRSACTKDSVISDNINKCIRCNYCKKDGHYINYCPKVICKRCGEGGHTDRVCKNPAQLYDLPVCDRCGREGHTEKFCWKCGKCGKYGHTTEVCRKVSVPVSRKVCTKDFSHTQDSFPILGKVISNTPSNIKMSYRNALVNAITKDTSTKKSMSYKDALLKNDTNIQIEMTEGMLSDLVEMFDIEDEINDYTFNDFMEEIGGEKNDELWADMLEVEF